MYHVGEYSRVDEIRKCSWETTLCEASSKFAFEKEVNRSLTWKSFSMSSTGKSINLLGPTLAALNKIHSSCVLPSLSLTSSKACLSNFVSDASTKTESTRMFSSVADLTVLISSSSHDAFLDRRTMCSKPRDAERQAVCTPMPGPEPTTTKAPCLDEEAIEIVAQHKQRMVYVVK